MALTEHLAMVLTANGAQAMTEFKKVGTTAERELGKAEGRADRMSAKFTNAGVKMVSTAAVMGAGLWKAGQASANLEASISTTESVFGTASAKIDEFGKTAANSVGMSNRAFHEQTALLGSFAKNMGFGTEAAADLSIALVKTASDMGAAFNKSPEEAIQAIGAAFRGETDPIEQFGISIREADIKAQIMAMGLDTSTTAAEKHSKALAIQALITKQTASISGQFAKELDTLAGKQARTGAASEDAAAALGEAFTPIMEKATQAAGWLANGLTGTDKATQSSASTMIAWGVVALGTAGVASSLVGQVIKMRESFTSAVDGVKSLANAMKNNVGATIGVGVAIGAATWILQNWVQKQQEANARAQEFTATLDKQSGAFTDNTHAAIQSRMQKEGLLDGLAKSSVLYEDVTRAIETSSSMMSYEAIVNNRLGVSREYSVQKLREEGGARNELMANLERNGALSEDMVRFITEESNAYDANAKALGDKTKIGAKNAEVEKQGAQVTEQQTGAWERATSRLTGYAAASSAASKRIEDLRSSTLGVSDAQRSYQGSLQSVADAQEGVTSAQRSLRDAQVSYVASQQKVIDAENARGDALRGVEAAQRNVISAQERINSVLGGGANGNDYELSLASARLSGKEAADRLTQAEKALGEAKTPEEKRRAELDLERAELGVAQSKNDIKQEEGRQQRDLTSAANDYNSARQSLTDAELAAVKAGEAINEAQRDVYRSAEAVAGAHKGVATAVKQVEQANYESFKSLDTLRGKLDDQKKSLLENKGAAADLINQWLIMGQLAPQLLPIIMPLVGAIQPVGPSPVQQDSTRQFQQGSARLRETRDGNGASSQTIKLIVDGREVAHVMERHLISNAKAVG